MSKQHIKDIGQYCRELRLKKNIPLKDFAILNNDNYKNIWAFENGYANNIKYIFYYTILFDTDDEYTEYMTGLFNIL